MKKIWVYILGVLSGIILVILYLFISDKSNNSDICFFDEPGEVVTIECFGKIEPVKSFKIFQTLDNRCGLALGEKFCAKELLVLVYSKTDQALFDNQTIIATDGKCFRQIGIYKYVSEGDIHKTIPIVMLMDGDNMEEEIDNTEKDKSYNFFDKPGDVMPDYSYKIVRVLNDRAAIARGKSENGSSYYGLEVLLWDESANFYDDQIIKATYGKCFRQIGIYKFGYKTLPIVKLMDNQLNL